MDNLLTPEETKEYIQHYIRFSGCIVSDKFTDIPYAIKDKYRELDDLLNQVARVELKKSETQAYKEKIEKLADPEKLREAIADCFRIARLEGVLTRYADGKSDADDVIDMLAPYIKQAKQEERERIAKFLNDGGDGMGGWCVGNASCKDTPNSKVDCVKCWQEALKGDKE